MLIPRLARIVAVVFLLLSAPLAAGEIKSKLVIQDIADDLRAQIFALNTAVIRQRLYGQAERVNSPVRQRYANYHP